MGTLHASIWSFSLQFYLPTDGVKTENWHCRGTWHQQQQQSAASLARVLVRRQVRHETTSQSSHNRSADGSPPGSLSPTSTEQQPNIVLFIILDRVPTLVSQEDRREATRCFMSLKILLSHSLLYFIFILWGGTRSLCMPMLRPAWQANWMHSPREGTSVVLRDTIRLTWWCV